MGSVIVGSIAIALRLGLAQHGVGAAKLYANSMPDASNINLFLNAVAVGKFGFPVYDNILAERAQPTNNEVECVFSVLYRVQGDCSRYTPAARRLTQARLSQSAKGSLLKFLSKYGDKNDIKLALAFLCSEDDLIAIGCLEILANFGGADEATLISAVLSTLDGRWAESGRESARNAIIRIDQRLAAEAAKPMPAPPAKKP